MKLTLTVYTDDTLQEIKRTVEADNLKIPYRVAEYVVQALGNADTLDTDGLFNLVTNSMDKVTKIIKATFGVTETELDCIDTMELVDTGVEIYKWAIDKLKGLKGGTEKNV